MLKKFLIFCLAEHSKIQNPKCTCKLNAGVRIIIAPGLQMISLASLKALKHEGLMSCGCGTFLHYTMCVHLMEDAMRKPVDS